MDLNAANLKKIDFSSVWVGIAYDDFEKSFKDMMGKLDSAIADVELYEEILLLREEYISKCDKLAELEEQMSNCDTSTEAGRNYYNQLKAQADALRTEIGLLKSDIEKKLAEIVNIPILELPKNGLGDRDEEIEIFFDIDELVEIYKDKDNLELTYQTLNEKNKDGIPTGLFDLYAEEGGEEYVNQQIADIVSKCDSNREIAVNVGLLLTKMAADKGYALTYQNDGAQGGYNTGYELLGGGTYHYDNNIKYNSEIVYNRQYNNITQMENGMDCCALVSYLINVATAEDSTVPNPEGFAYQTEAGLANFGEQVTVSETRAGDVFNWTNDHVGLVLETNADSSNPGTGTITFLESGGRNDVVKGQGRLAVNEYSYTENDDGTITISGHSINKKTKLFNYDSVYSGEEQSKR